MNRHPHTAVRCTPFLIERMREYAPPSRVFLSVDGEPVGPAEGRGEDPVPESDPETARRSLTGMRRYLMRQVDAHLILGGRRGGFQGTLPGLLEEALLALEADLPVLRRSPSRARAQRP
ncbi:hypothetical protein ABT121_10470 [Streptomyces sp. NPDC001928]|uniref:hypothetical protein n=1 Tax=Streptomyces sp. NPDC001928 TaxID=3154404 RepID=UPI00332DF3F8